MKSPSKRSPRPGKAAIKQVLGGIPLTAELYWQLRQQGKPLSKSFSLQRVRRHLPEWITAVTQHSLTDNQLPIHESRNIFLFTTLRYWIEHSVLLSLSLVAQGHSVTLAYLPVNNWQTRMNRFDLRRQNAYAHDVLKPAEKLIRPLSLLDLKPDGKPLPESLTKAIQAVSLRDVQYTLQIEEVDPSSDLFRLRLEHNNQTASVALNWFKNHRPDVVLTPNGSILEMGAIYQTARFLEIPVITYEFGEQRERIWLAHNDEVMLQNTAEFWQIWKDIPLSAGQLEQIHALYASRQDGRLWENFSRRWQGLPAQGGEITRQALGLDERPLAVLAANVIGDSLTLNRQVFSQSMTEWLQRTLRNFAQRPEVQLVVRIHPGERYTKGPSVADVIRDVFSTAAGVPELPENIHLVAAGDPINTYDLVAIADLGLVYTTTVGMEMAMSGVPTIVAGKTHYSGKGFTLDPDNWEDYFEMINHQLKIDDSKRLSTTEAVQNIVNTDLAWQYAYRFFFTFPRPFPWHMLYFYDELTEWPLERVLSAEGQAVFGETFQQLIGGFSNG